MQTKARGKALAPKRALALLLALVLALGLLTVAAPAAKADGPDWPQLTSLNVTDGLVYDRNKVAQAIFACSVDHVEIENYDEVQVAYSDNMVGVVRIYVNTPRTVESGVVTETAAEFPTEGSLYIIKSTYSAATTAGTIYDRSVSAAKVEGENKYRSTTNGVRIDVTQGEETISYKYYLEFIPVEEPDWPQLTSLSVTDGLVYDRNKVAQATFACSVDHVEIENYDEVQVAYSDNMVGVVRIYVNTPRTVEGGVVTETAAEFPTEGSLYIIKSTYSAATTAGTIYDRSVSAAKVEGENKYRSTTNGVRIDVTQGEETISYKYYLEFIPVENSAPNTAPTIKSGVTNPVYTEAAAGTPWTLNLTTIFEDAENNPLTYTVKVGSAAPVAADASYSYTPADGSETTLVFVANDGKLDSPTYTVVLNPAPNNAPNIKDGVENPASVRIALGQRWDLALYSIFEDADGDALSYTVKVGDAEPVAATSTNYYQFTPTEAGVTTFEFRASDGRDESIAYTVNLTAVVNNRPTRKAGIPESAYANAIVGEAWTIDLSTIFEDADGDELTYSVRISGYNTESTPAVYSYMPTAAGQYSLNFSASDGLQGSPTYTVTLSASNPNNAPVVKAGVVNPASATVAVGQAWTIDLSTVFEDPDGSSLSYKVKVNGADAVTASRNYSYTPETAGVTTLVFTAVDNQNEESTDTYTVTVTADASLHVITASTEDYYQWNNYTCNAMGIITVKVGGNDVVAAAAGDTVTVTAIPQSILEGYVGAGTYVSAFAGWTAAGIELTQQQAQSAELTFTMPDNPVSLTAAFVKVGSEVTLTANDFTAGDVEFGIDNWPGNSGNSTWDYNTSQHGRDSVTDIVPAGKTVTVHLLGTHYSAYYLARWEVVNTTTNEPVEVTLDNPQNYPGTGGEYGQYYWASFTVDGTSSYTITAIFEARDYGDVTVTVNDSTMGTAAAQVGSAAAATELAAVIAGETVTLTAAPNTGYVFTGWTAAYGTTPVEITNANQMSTCFVMPATNRAAVNVTANFARDPQYASHDCELIDLYLYDGGAEVDYSVEQDGNDLLVTLDEGVNAYYLKDWTLVLELSDYASATVNGVAWPSAGKVIGSAITVNEPATIVVTAEDGTTATAYTLTVVGEVTPVPVEITAQPQDAAAKAGKKASFQVAATGGSGAYTYQWYYRKSASGAWTPVSAASGSTAKYSLTVQARHDGYQYYCVVTDAAGNTASSGVATLTVVPALSIVTQPEDVTAPAGETVSVTVVAQGEGLSYQWYVKKPTAAKFSKSSITDATYSVALTEARSGNQIYCVVTDAYGDSIQSNTVTLTAAPALTVADLADFEGPVDSEVSFTVQPEGVGPFTYQWYVKKPTARKFSKSTSPRRSTA